MRRRLAGALAAGCVAAVHAAGGIGDGGAGTIASLLRDMEDMKGQLKAYRAQLEAQQLETRRALDAQRLEVQRVLGESAAEGARARWRLSAGEPGRAGAYLGVPPPPPSCPGLNVTSGIHIVDKAWQSLQLPAGKQLADCCTECGNLGCVALEFVPTTSTCNLFNKMPSRFASAAGSHAAFKGRVPPSGAHDGVPIGAVLSWWRPSAAVPLPQGFEVCDGTTVATNFSPYYGLPKPDLRGRFVKGCTDPSEIGRVGGSAASTGAGNGTGSINITAEPLTTDASGEHTHTFTVPDFPHTPKSGNCHYGASGTHDTGSGGSHSHAIPAHSHAAAFDVRVTVAVPVDPPYVGLLQLMRVI